MITGAVQKDTEDKRMIVPTASVIRKTRKILNIEENKVTTSIRKPRVNH